MSGPDLLFLAHRIPYPPKKGDTIRSGNMLRHLARDCRLFHAARDGRRGWRGGRPARARLVADCSWGPQLAYFKDFLEAEPVK